MKSRTILVLLVFLFVCTFTFAQEDRISKLKKRILAQQEVIQQMEKQVERKEQTTKAYTEKIVADYLAEPNIDKGTGVTAGYNKGFFVQSGDGDFKLKINGYTLQRLTVFEKDTPGVNQDNTFAAASFRVDFHIYLFKDWHVRIRPDFANGILQEGYIEYLGLDFLKIRAGAFITPFSVQHGVAPHDLMTLPMYSPYLFSMPLRDVGVMIFGDGLPFLFGEFFSDYFSHSIGMFNGEGQNNANTDDDMMFVGAARIYPLTKKEKGIFVAASILYSKDDYENNSNNIRLRGLGNYEIFGDNLSGDVADTCGHTVGTSVAANYRKDNLRIEYEFAWVRKNRDADVNIPTRRSPLETWGMSLGLSYFIAVGEEDSNMGVEPLFKVSYTEVDDMDGDGSATAANPIGTVTDVRGIDIWEVVLGAKYHFNKHIRADFNWVMYIASRPDLFNHENNPDRMVHSFMFQIMAKW